MKLLQVGLLLIITFCFLTGCAGLEQRSLGEIADDAAITSSVNAKYVKDDLVSAMKVNVDTFLGEVTLSGMVDNQAAATRAIDLALSTKNVTKVISNLTIRNQALSPRGEVYQ